MGWKSKFKGSEVDFLLGNVGVESITYANLKKLRDNSDLFPGKFYRITDYKTIISSAIASVNITPQFDIIVLALSKNRLSEIAYAIHHSGDEYFQHSDVNGWRLKYCLDNDTTRFDWANENGKGVIYWMKDEWGNEAPYDFKTIMFNRNGENLYTFTVDDQHGNNEASNYLNVGSICSNNIIRENYDSDGKLVLSMNIFVAYYIAGQEGFIMDNYVGPGSYGNYYGLDSIGNYFEGGNYNISFPEQGCSYNFFGRGCHDIILKSLNQHNRFYDSSNIVADAKNCVFEFCKDVSFVGGSSLTAISVENSKFLNVHNKISNTTATTLGYVLVYGNVTGSISSGSVTGYKEYGINRGE